MMPRPRPSFQWLAWRPSPNVTPVKKVTVLAVPPLIEKYLPVVDAEKSIAPCAALTLE